MCIHICGGTIFWKKYFEVIGHNALTVTLVCLVEFPSLYTAVHDTGAECTIILTNRHDKSCENVAVIKATERLHFCK